ncbi:hypothetical protein [Natronorubrum sulfidifaciens]|uniref:Uncharacterized protein n=1 Tax=Natronorubrum sulfidifaciens JCM 14089 TaxID=1230460 RepID=L9WEJ0_9EURY|nr:hypothetical protein [Natronorubrum sulfidifaciens]ELY46728.1 hypothetical protein C495_06458 [Natronorubrum sulfidifaciens JCM 14089]
MRTPRSRRALLTTGVSVAVALPGCLETQLSSTDDPNESSVVAPAAYDCAESDRPHPPDPVPDDAIEPGVYPSRPVSLAEAGDQYVLEFERAYRRNAFLAEYGSETRTFDFRFQTQQMDVLESDPERDAVLVSIVYDLTTAIGQLPESTERDTRVTYYADETVVLRAPYTGGLADEPSFDPDPRDAGEPVVCFE